MSLFVKKPLARLLSEAEESEKGLKRTLNARSLVALGIGAIIGAGLFSLTGLAAGNHAGPAVTISFVIAAIGCAFAGLCYAEFASMIPIAGSAYTYSYATMGEFMAWIIGWDLVLEYALGAATVSISWSQYFLKLMGKMGIHFPISLALSPFESTVMNGETIHGIMNVPAVIIIVLLSLLLMRGTRGSAFVNSLIVVLKVAVVLFFIAFGWSYMNPQNHEPFIPPNTGQFGSFGWSGIFRAAAIIFFAFIGFDAVSTAAQEAKNPQKDMPIGILGSLIICTVLYLLFSYVMTGLADYHEFTRNPEDKLAPVSLAISHTPYRWLDTGIIVAILGGYSSVMLVMLLGQSRVFYSMSNDGLIGKIFSDIHQKHKTPHKSNLLFMAFVSLFAAFVPGGVVGEMVSIGTLLAFVLVSIGVLVMRNSQPDVKRPFRTPLVPLVPILGVLVCFAMMASLPLDTWLRLIIWMMIGFDIYIWFGAKHSKLGNGTFNRKGFPIAVYTGIILCVILVMIGFLHHNTIPEGSPDNLLPIALVVGGLHLVFYLIRLQVLKKNQPN